MQHAGQISTSGVPHGQSPGQATLERPKSGLPEVFVVGAAKGGTTALYRYFELHPQVFVPGDVKETNFMAFAGGMPPLNGPRDASIVGRRSVANLADYEKLFRQRGDETVAADVSPSYLYYPQAAERIRELVPQAKVVIILRNPIECAFSMYSMMRRDRREPCRTFWRAFNKSAQRRAAGWEWAWDYQGCYQFAAQVKGYLERFAPGQLFLRQYEQLKREPVVFYRELAEFLGVAAIDSAEANRRFNVSPRRIDMLKKYKLGRAVWHAGRWADRVAPRTCSDVVKRWMGERAFRLSEKDRRRLADYYRDDIVELGRTLAWNVDDWLKV